MEELRLYNTEAEYQAQQDIKYPTICYIKELDSIKYCKKPVKIKIAYVNNGNTFYIDYTEYDTSMGDPIGIVVIPEGILPDKRARMMHLYDINTNGENSHTPIKFNSKAADTPLKNFNKVPTTDNLGSTTTGSYNFGYLPSDAFEGQGAQSFVDPKAYYNYTAYFIPSPYNGDELNTEYCKTTTSFNNCMSDLNGGDNTAVIKNLGSTWAAANAVYNLTDRQWYIPSIGELGFVLVRLKEINEALTIVGGQIFEDGLSYWSSTERDTTNMWYLYTSFGVGYTAKTNSCYLRPFRKI